MVAGLNILSLTEIKELETYFGTSLAVAEAAAMGVGARERETDSKLELLLDVLETLWTTQAMKERHFDAWFAALTRAQRNEVECHIRYYNDTCMLVTMIDSFV